MIARLSMSEVSVLVCMHTDVTLLARPHDREAAEWRADDWTAKSCFHAYMMPNSGRVWSCTSLASFDVFLEYPDRSNPMHAGPTSAGLGLCPADLPH